MVRVAHVSDIHVTVRPLGWSLRDFFSKRATSRLNLRLHRGKLFRQGDDVLRAFERDRLERKIEHVIFSGDASNFGLPSEIERAADALGVVRGPGLAVPGNHDYLVHAAQQSGAFERAFAPWQQGERIGSDIYPFAQRVGEAWLIGVNSARPNRWMWDATGLVGVAQAERLKQLLATLPAGPRILVTHYPIALKSGRTETPNHGLVDLLQILEIARAGQVRCWLHGHRHGFYQLDNPLGFGIPAICIGSGTQHECWSYGEYEISAQALSGRRRIFDPQTAAFIDGEAIQINFASPTPVISAMSR